jgi:[ribosomal protein S18]-alanine N-acetyltransferase
MNSDLIFRDYRPADIEAMFRLDELCFTKEFRFSRESMQEFAQERNAIVRVAEAVGGEIVGFVIVHIERVASERRAYVVTLDVDPGCRRQGIAMKLMNAVEAAATAARARWIQLHVFVGNEGAIRFYEEQGYEQVGMRADFYGQRLDALIYRKEL